MPILQTSAAVVIILSNGRTRSGGKKHEERGPVLARAFDTHASPLRLGEPLHERQAEPPAVMRVRRRSGRGVEGREDSAKVLGRDGHPFIMNLQLDLRSLLFERNEHGPIEITVLDRVRAEILDDSPNSIGA